MNASEMDSCRNNPPPPTTTAADLRQGFQNQMSHIPKENGRNGNASSKSSLEKEKRIRQNGPSMT